jgi:hypothetical protein
MHYQRKHPEVLGIFLHSLLLPDLRGCSSEDQPITEHRDLALLFSSVPLSHHTNSIMPIVGIIH